MLVDALRYKEVRCGARRPWARFKPGRNGAKAEADAMDPLGVKPPASVQIWTAYAAAAV